MNERPDTFMRREWPFVEGLEPWLDKATHGLCADAVERVCREVVEHCKASIEAKLAAGMPLAEVDRAVMAELGSWRAARRAFRKTNLTFYEELGLQNITKEQPLHVLGWVAFYALYFGGMFAVYAALPDGNINPLLPSLPVVLFGTTPLWALPILKRFLGLGDPRRLIRGFAAIQCVMASLTLPWTLFLTNQMTAEYVPESQWFVLLVAAIPVCGLCYIPYLTWQLQYKLPNEGGEAKP
jgi:hypothetical protein